ncbi:MAG: nicotinate-nucleotide adenylyltransferase [Oscillatoriaceae bacterium SKW80]|nr:nicotinate-nucleotide adenylyltransferase [Oscillatoriaceae bacterium SKYG93]MCX8120657.1 nicotinate-nucleotide adenylyltransferase [Oscillatoriaceae bacterium SKW80]MDW8453805.1 nicotinate-nucleotide adenylyltransferase [Oscillatoriaceae cyanobacterium SKYGB_i_bin93]HIK27035.1 nicotinate-nucleotide adenylyltransferase [Oscillatoriaceae cyanobacterium M7585_C2015_266]
MVNIALFGTSADPPTTGHQQIIIWLSQNFDYVAVWASDNPFKSHQTPLEHRETMLRLLIEEISPPATNVALHPELSSPKTLITVERARQKWPSAEFTLTIGSDLVTQLPRWYCVQKLLQEVKLLVIPRPGYAVKEEDIELLRSLGARVASAPLFAPAVSSTQVRKCAQKEALTPPIQAYIHREQLYACREAN